MEQLKLRIKSNVIMMSFVILLLYGCKDIRVINYYLPKDFVGNVAIIYSNTSKRSKQPEVYNYTIPENGILYSNYSYSEGYYIINFYQKNNFNSYDTLMQEVPMVKIDTAKNRVYFNRTLSFKIEGGKETYVNAFYVGKAKASDLGKDRFLFERKLEKIILDKK